ncbi:hypothetical protein GDO78_009903 [Eleutherodactylus coqui]|uniref:Uncharacterized protein n=1 Tax=Eleutherodactylus coqui TaxID=57060 RepID=A0A8J6K8Z9_ELECQ|nr:hypothetical protein GDO78_009903 [Eleutherodactylus coqui]
MQKKEDLATMVETRTGFVGRGVSHWTICSANDVSVLWASSGAVMVRLSSVLRFQKRKTSWLLAWLPENMENWRSRLALTYAMTVWSMIGFVAFMNFRTKDKNTAPPTDEDPFLHPEADPFESRQSVSSSIVMEYKPNPVSTRLYQFFTPNNKTSDSQSTED